MILNRGNSFLYSDPAPIQSFLSNLILSDMIIHVRYFFSFRNYWIVRCLPTEKCLRTINKNSVSVASVSAMIIKILKTKGEFYYGISL